MRGNRSFGYLLGMDNLTNPSIDNDALSEIIQEGLPPEFDDPNYSFTSDKTPFGLDDLHLDDRFQGLFQEITASILQYFSNMAFQKAEYYISKAWATYTKQKQFIATHKHVASHYSFVYYVQADEEIHSPITFYEPAQGLRVPESKIWNADNYRSLKIKPKTGLFIMFPSHVEHGTEEMAETDVARISISGDIVITAEGGHKTEYLLPSPSTWRKLNGPVTH